MCGGYKKGENLSSFGKNSLTEKTMDNRFARQSAGAGDFWEGNDMSKIKWDLESAKWVADKAQNDISVFPVELIECDKCGAVFLPHIGHDCDNTVDVEFHEGVEYGRTD